MDLVKLSDEELAEQGHTMPALVQAEFSRRQTILFRESGEEQKRTATAMVETAKATIETAEATKRTAEATRQNARYMLWSVIVLAGASALNLIVTFFHHSN